MLIRVAIVQGSGYAAALIWNLVLARRVSVDVFGTLTFAFTIMTLLQLMLGAGCSQAIVKFQSHGKGDIRVPRASIIIPFVSSGILILVIHAVYPICAGVWRTLSASDWSSVVLMGLSLALLGIAGAVFQARRRPASAALMNPTLGSLLILASVMVATFSGDVEATPILGIASIILVIPAVLIVLRMLILGRRWSRDQSRQVGGDGFVAFGAKSMMIGLVYMGITHLDRLMLGLLSTPAEVGVYGVAARLASLLYLVVYLLPPVVAPIYASCGLRKDEEGGRVYEASTALVARIVLPLALIMLLAGGDILAALAGPQYREGAGILGVLALSVFLVTATGNNGLMLQMGGRENWEMAMNLGALAINVILNLLMIPRWGGLGAAYATAASLFVSTLCKTIICWRIWGVTPAMFRMPDFIVAILIAAPIYLVAVKYSGVAAKALAFLVIVIALARPTAIAGELRILSSTAGRDAAAGS